MSKTLSQVIFLVAGLAMIAFAWLWRPEHASDSAAQKPPATVAKKIEILSAAKQLEPGHLISADDAEWVSLTTETAESGAMTRSDMMDNPNPYLGRVVVEQVKAGQALLPQHFMTKETGNYIAGLLAPGKRAFAIVIDNKGTASAGNFILPNDYVDVIRSSNTNAGLASEMILSNIRVLAIGSSIHGDGLSLVGETATVEVDIREAEILATAQRAGQISLALRRANDESNGVSRANTLVIIRPNSTTPEKNP